MSLLLATVCRMDDCTNELDLPVFVPERFDDNGEPLNAEHQGFVPSRVDRDGQVAVGYFLDGNPPDPVRWDGEPGERLRIHREGHLETWCSCGWRSGHYNDTLDEFVHEDHLTDVEASPS